MGRESWNAWLADLALSPPILDLCIYVCNIDNAMYTIPESVAYSRNGKTGKMRTNGAFLRTFDSKRQHTIPQQGVKFSPR